MSVVSFASFADVQARVGTTIGPSAWLRIEQSRIDEFARATDDFQWIHVDPDRAASGPFGATIAHGYLTLSLVGRFSTELLELPFAASVVNYGLNKVRFPAPTPVGSRLRATIHLDSLESTPRGEQLTVTTSIEREASERPSCIAQSVLLVTPKA